VGDPLKNPWEIPSSHGSTAASQVLVPSKPRTDDQNQIFEAGKFRSKTQQKTWGIYGWWALPIWLVVWNMVLVGGLEHGWIIFPYIGNIWEFHQPN
jgi:hypothetical protein